MALFTSIRPPSSQQVSYLRQCLDSWRAAGFDAVAVNGPAEINVLRDLDLPVEYAAVASDGKPRIGTVLSAIHARGCRFAGIINSDCCIVGYPRLADNLQVGLERSVMLAWRLDVSDDAAPAAAQLGFDAFFFDADRLSHDDAGFSIGEPWWDLWFPLTCALNHARIETLAVPMLTHKVHVQNWSEDKWFAGGQRLWTILRTTSVREKIDKSLSARIPANWWKQDTLSPAQLRKLSHIIPGWLHECCPQTTSILGPEGAEVESIIRLGGRAMLAGSAAAHELARMQNSPFWRLTAPLRNAVMAARYFTSTLASPSSGHRAS
jgi:hypothetical protein